MEVTTLSIKVRDIPETLCVNFDANGAPYIEDTSNGNCHVGISYVRADMIEEYCKMIKEN